MNLLCPNCQKMLTVPEQYAGQLMKCPLCAGTFTVPTLPPIPSAPEPVPAPPPPPPSPPVDTYGLRQETTPPMPVPPPSFQPEPVPTTSAPASVAPPRPSMPGPSAPPAGYTKSCSVSFCPTTLQWVAPACILLIFFLTFFTWVGLMPGGVYVLTQGAWSSGFGTTAKYIDTSKVFPTKEVTELESKLGPSYFIMLYDFFFLPTLILTVAMIVLLYVKIQLPPQIEKFLPYRWGLVAVLNLLIFLFLALQMLMGFNLEARNADRAKSIVDDAFVGQPDSSEISNGKQAKYAEEVARVQRTFWLDLVVLLHLLAVISAALMYWLHQRGESRPLPKMELLY
jgi:hypothetical protein